MSVILASKIGEPIRPAVHSHAASGAGSLGLAGDDDRSVLSCCCQQSYVPGIAREDAIAWGGQQHDGRIDRIRGTGRSLDNACVASIALADRAHIDSPR